MHVVDSGEPEGAAAVPAFVSTRLSARAGNSTRLS